MLHGDYFFLYRPLTWIALSFHQGFEGKSLATWHYSGGEPLDNQASIKPNKDFFLNISGIGCNKYTNVLSRLRGNKKKGVGKQEKNRVFELKFGK